VTDELIERVEFGACDDFPQQSNDLECDLTRSNKLSDFKERELSASE